MACGRTSGGGERPARESSAWARQGAVGETHTVASANTPQTAKEAGTRTRLVPKNATGKRRSARIRATAAKGAMNT